MVVSPFLYKVNNIVFNYLNKEYVIFDDLNHPFFKLFGKRFSKKDFRGYEEDLEWLIKEKFIFNEDDIENFYKSYMISDIHNSNLHLVLMPAGTNCNFDCKYCYQSHKDKFFTDEDIKNIIDFINNFNSDKVQLDFFGGEPLLNKRAIFKILDGVKKEVVSHITTNGYLLDFDTFESLVDKGLKTFQITVDGYKKLHDFLRPLNSGKGTFERIIKNLEKISESDKNFRIIFRVNFNEDFDVDKFINFIQHKKFFKDKRFLYLFRPIQSGWNGSFNSVSCKINPSIKFDFYEKILGIGLIPADYVLLSLTTNFYCPSGKKNYFIITPGGIVKKCTVALDNPKNIVGKLENGNIFLNENHDLWIEKELYPKDECKSCNLLTLCGGKMCPLKRIEKNEIQCIDFKDNQHDLILNLVKFREIF